MTQTEALRVLAEKVEAGEGLLATDVSGVWRDAYQSGRYDRVTSAHGGSLDAAKALHEAVLPGWTAAVVQNMHHNFWLVHVSKLNEYGAAIDYSASDDDNPARSWLLAIIRAKIAMLEKSDAS